MGQPAICILRHDAARTIFPYDFRAFRTFRHYRIDPSTSHVRGEVHRTRRRTGHGAAEGNQNSGTCGQGRPLTFLHERGRRKPPHRPNRWRAAGWSGANTPRSHSQRPQVISDALPTPCSVPPRRRKHPMNAAQPERPPRPNLETAKRSPRRDARRCRPGCARTPKRVGICFRSWKRIVTGVAPGLQIQWNVERRSVGSTPMRFRQYHHIIIRGYPQKRTSRQSPMGRTCSRGRGPSSRNSGLHSPSEWNKPTAAATLSAPHAGPGQQDERTGDGRTLSGDKALPGTAPRFHFPPGSHQTTRRRHPTLPFDTQNDR